MAIPTSFSIVFSSGTMTRVLVVGYSLAKFWTCSMRFAPCLRVIASRRTVLFFEFSFIAENLTFFSPIFEKGGNAKRKISQSGTPYRLAASEKKCICSSEIGGVVEICASINFSPALDSGALRSITMPSVTELPNGTFTIEPTSRVEDISSPTKYEYASSR